MPNTFRARLAQLSEQVGDGVLEGLHFRAQPYAAEQETELGYRHPRGGQAQYTQAALADGARAWFRHLADNLLTGDVNAAMADNMNAFDAEASRRAPVLTGRLRASGGAIVTDNGTQVSYRAPAAPYAVVKTEGVPGD